MSQAVSAPNTGEPFVTGGKSADVTASRRGLLAGLALLAPAGALATEAAAATQPGVDRTLWDKAHHEYRRLTMLDDAYYKLGPVEWANEAFEQAKLQRDSDPDALRRAGEALHKATMASEAYYVPAREAALVLVRTPAPDLDAVLVKMELHDRHLESTVHNELTWTCIVADLERLKA